MHANRFGQNTGKFNYKIHYWETDVPGSILGPFSIVPQPIVAANDPAVKNDLKKLKVSLFFEKLCSGFFIINFSLFYKMALMKVF